MGSIMKEAKSIPKERLSKLNELFECFSAIADDTHVYLCDMVNDYSRWSSNMVNTFGLESEYMFEAGKKWEEFIHPEDKDDYHAGIEAVFNGGSITHDMQYRARTKDGNYEICTCKGFVIHNDNGEPDFFGGSIRVHSQQRHIDSLTGLRNQYGFFSEIDNLIRTKTPAKIGLLGIGKLSEINEVYGYQKGNEVLQLFGRYLLDYANNQGIICRIDGSKFGIITSTQSIEDLERIYADIRSYFRRGLKFDDINDLPLELNAGVLTLDDFTTDVQTIYTCLNFAFDESKSNCHGDLVEFNNNLNDRSTYKIEILHRIRCSISDGFKGFYLLYQPVVDAKTEKIIGVEALLRWADEVYGEVPPDAFIPVLEIDPLFPVLGEWIIRQSLKDSKKFLALNPDLVVNVNVSYSQLEKSDFTDMVWNVIKDEQYPAKNLCLEITERCRLLNIDLLKNIMVVLKSGEVKVALDDFGTGYSSVGLLKKLPFDIIKIDRSFVMNIEKDDMEKQLVSKFTEIASLYNAKVCVEGIETKEMGEILRNYKVNSFQGYYYSKPVKCEEIIKRITNDYL